MGRYPKSSPPYTCQTCTGTFRPKNYETQFCSRKCVTEAARIAFDPAKRFEQFYIPEPNSGCWLWLGAPGSHGYGVMEITDSKILAHRFSYTINVGPIPEGSWILHRCDNRICVNPEHLYPGDNDANVADMHRRKRHSHGETHPRAKFTEAEASFVKVAAGTHQEIADRYGVHRVTVTNIKSGKNWSHLP